MLYKYFLNDNVIFKKVFSVFLIGFCLSSHLMNAHNSKNDKENYYRFLDSSEYYVSINSKKALSFLDSIPDPAEKNIKGRIGDYYYSKATVYYDKHELTKSYQYFLSSIRHAEEENNFDLAGDACVDVFLLLYQLDKAGEANYYLKKAKSLYTKSGNEVGLLDVMQLPAYMKFQDNAYEESNVLVLKHMRFYKASKNKFPYFMAAYLLTSNYLELGNYKDAQNYFPIMKSLKGSNGVKENEFLFYQGVLNLDFANYFSKRKHTDSTFHFLALASKINHMMDSASLKKYYGLYAEVYKQIEDEEMRQVYTDSLAVFETSLLHTNLAASFEINESLSQSELNLESARKKKRFNFIISLCILVLFLILGFVFFKNFQKVKLKLTGFKNRLSELTYLKHNQDKLTAKIHGLEEYIKNLKQDIKSISNIREVSEQREKIKELYKNLHIDSYSVLAEGKNHLGLINELNVDFFKQLKEAYPSLNESESILCYYLFMGFKNKEIAFFLNTSIRSIESKRYRITKKMGLVKGELNLVEHLQNYSNI